MVSSNWSASRVRALQDKPRPILETREFSVGSSVMGALAAGVNAEGRFESPNVRGAFQGSSGASFVTQSLAGESGVSKPFEEITWIRNGIKAFSQGLANLEVRTLSHRPGSQEAQPVEGTPINALLEDPHPLYTSSEFWAAITTYYKVDGEGFIFMADKNGDPMLPVEDSPTPGMRKIKVPAQLCPVRGRLVEHRCGKGGMPIAYRFYTSEESGDGSSAKGSSFSKDFPPESVINIRDFTPDDPIRGFGDVTALANEINQYQQVYRYLEGLLRSGGDPGAWIIYPKRLATGELERRQEIIDDENTPENAGRTKIIDGEAKVVPNPVSPKDMEYQSYLEWLRDSILSTMGVPPPMAGVYDDATYNNIKTAEEILWTGPNGILSLIRKIEDVLRVRLFRRLEDARMSSLWPSWDVASVEALQDDEVDLHVKAAEVASRGVGVSMNEQLRRFQVTVDEPEDGSEAQGEERFVAVGLQQVLEDEAGDKGASPSQSLTGIQIAQLIAIVEKVTQGTLPKVAAEEIIVTALNIPRERASDILRAVVEGSVSPPTTATPPVLSDTGAKGVDEGRSHDPEAKRRVGGGPATVPRPFRRAHTPAQAERLRQWNAVLAKLYDEDGPVAPRSLVAGLTQWFTEYRDAQLMKLDAQGARSEYGTIISKLAAVHRGKDESDAEMMVRAGLTNDDLARMTLNESKWAQRLADLSRSPITEALRSVLELMQSEGLSPVMNLADPDVVEGIRTQVIKLAEGVTSTTTARVRNAMIRAMVTRDPDVLLTDAIRDALPEIRGEVSEVFKKRQIRANAIARTEVGKAQSTVLVDEMKASGVTKKGWRTSGRANVRDTHAALNGVEIEMDATYSNGLRHPHDPRGSAAEVVNCACSPYAAEISEDLGIDD